MKFSIIIIFLFSSCLTFDDDSNLVKPDDNYTYAERIGRTVNNRTDIQFSSFSGMETIVHITTDNDEELLIVFISNISEGNFSIVLISPDNEVVQILSNTDKGQKSFILKKGVSRIKIVGSETSGTVQFEIAGDFKTDYGR